MYLNTSHLLIDWNAGDAGGGIASQSATLDGHPVTKGQKVDLFFLPLGLHTVTVNVTDNGGNTTSDSASFSIIVTASSLNDSIDRLLAMHAIKSREAARDLKEKLDDRPYELREFLHELAEQRGRKISQQAYDILKAGALYLITHSSRHFHGRPDRDDHDHHDSWDDRDGKDSDRDDWGKWDRDEDEHYAWN